MKFYIRAMSMDRKRILRELESCSIIIMEHTIKLLVFSSIRTNDTAGWMGTIAKWLHKLDNITVRPSGKKVKQKDLDYWIFEAYGDTVKDFDLTLHAFWADNRAGKFNYNGKESYPEFEITPELADDLMHIWYDLRDATVPLLADKKDHSKQDYVDAVNKVFKDIV